MSCEIYYDRKFLKVGDKFIPLLQHGSNNCFEVNWQGREIPEKIWSVQNYKKPGQYIFSQEEIHELAEIYSTCEMSKSRYRSYTPDEIKRLFINGMKSAQSLEYYLDLGNTFFITDWTDWDNKVTYSIYSTQDLVDTITRLEGKKLSLKFGQRNLYLPLTRRKKKEQQKVKQYYVLVLSSIGRVFYSLKKYGYSFTPYKNSGKKFRTEKEALAYVNKYEDRLKGFAPVLVQSEAYL